MYRGGDARLDLTTRLYVEIIKMQVFVKHSSKTRQPSRTSTNLYMLNAFPRRLDRFYMQMDPPDTWAFIHSGTVS